MHGIEPRTLTTQELLDYVHLFGYDKLTPVWVAELAKRLEEAEKELDPAINSLNAA